MTELAILREALRHGAAFSHDERTQVGAVLVTRRQMLYAANIVPPGVARNPEADKYAIIEHAERAVIYKAAAAGVPTAGAKLYAPWFACPDCARAIILAGIVEVVGLASLAAATPERWRQKIADATRMLEQAGVSTRWLAGAVGAKIIFNGEVMEC
jgi:dCMP deaminase